MRIEPDRDTLPALRPTASSASSTAGFASALVSARNSLDPSLPAATDLANAGQTPLAQRWGEYGNGATAEGYSAPPDPAQYADLPVGPDQPASPLNPGGITTTPAFTVDGYTGRGTPVPPGFYNLAYYNWYLREGGTPLAGFPQLADGATISETYGTFGDGAARATSFITAPTTPCKAGAASAAAATAADPAGATTGGNATPAAQSPATASVAAALAVVAKAASASSSTTAAAPPVATVSDASAGATPAATAGAVPPTSVLAAALRADLTALLSDLLRVA